MPSSRRRLHRLGRGGRPLASAGGFVWPVGIDWDADDAQRPLCLWEGVGHGAAAARCTPAEALAPAWDEHFALCGAGWLRPLLARMSGGERVAWDEIARAHALAHGDPPEPIEVGPPADR